MFSRWCGEACIGCGKLGIEQVLESRAIFSAQLMPMRLDTSRKMTASE
jgi:hypothetical protein